MKKLLLAIFLLICSAGSFAQWTPKGNGVIPSGYGINSFRVVGQDVIWATVMEWQYYNFLQPPPSPLPVYALRSTDGGENWQLINIPGGDGYYLYDIIALDSNRAYITSTSTVGGLPASGRLWYTEDGGATWQFKTPADMQNAIGFYLRNFSDQEWLSFGFPTVIPFGNMVGRTTDGGQTWTSITTPDIGTVDGIATINSLNGMAVQDDYIYTATFAGFVYRSRDRGATWQKLSTQYQLAGYNISFTDTINGVICSNFNSNGIQVPTTIIGTNDGGDSWNVLPAPPEMLNITHVPGMPGTYVGTDYVVPGHAQKGSYLSFDNCNSWIAIDTTIPLNCVSFLSSTSGFASYGAASDGSSPAIYKWTGVISSLKEYPSATFAIKLMPNPASSTLRLQFEKQNSEELSYSIYDLNGRLVKSDTFLSAAGKNSIELSISDIANGTYQFTLAGKQMVASEKLVVIH